jgi:hypothetical protein
MSNLKTRLIAACAGIAIVATASLAYAEPSADMIQQQLPRQMQQYSTNAPMGTRMTNPDYTGSLKPKSFQSPAPTAKPACSNSRFDQNTDIACNNPLGG